MIHWYETRGGRINEYWRSCRVREDSWSKSMLALVVNIKRNEVNKPWREGLSSIDWRGTAPALEEGIICFI